MGIKENLADVNIEIKNACSSCGRDPSSVRLIAVSKTKPVADILEAVSAGQMIFGENYAQELRDKAEILKEEVFSLPSPLPPLLSSVEWHFIGHLQKNKLKYVLPVAKWIHTIDSVELLNEMVGYLAARPELACPEQCRGVEGRNVHASTGSARTFRINCLIEVNIAGEDSKSGVSPEKVFSLVEAFSTYAPFDFVPRQARDFAQGTLTHCALRGLMCMPPFSSDPETSRPYFRKLKNLLDEINSRNIYPEKLTELSMGMTQDYKVAIEEGATMVRIGSAIFGERASGFAGARERGLGGNSEV